MLLSCYPGMATEVEQNAIITKIESNLFFPITLRRSNKEAVISFDVQPLGHITNVVINENDVPNEIVNQCMLAINKSTPFANVINAMHINFICANLKSVTKNLQPPNFDKKMAGKYMDTIQKQINFHWHPVKSPSPYLVGLKFKVDKTGKAYDIKNALSSGNADYDLIAIKAVEAASPLTPPPAFFFEGKNIDHIEIEFTLECKIKQRASNLDKVNFGLNLLDLLD